jgi:hypothetical protein
MKILSLPAGTTHIQYSELAHLIADALWPDEGENELRIKYGCARINLDGELLQAVKSGALPVKDPLTLGPHTFPFGNALLTALVTVDDLRTFIEGRDLELTFEPAQPEPTKRHKNEFGHPDLNLSEFTLPSRVLRVDPALLARLAIDPDSQIRFRDGQGGSGVALVGDFIQVIEKAIARQADGFFIVNEAARILADSPAGGDYQGWRTKMYEAWQAGDLIIRDTTKTRKSLTSTNRAFMDLVKETDLAAWLEKDGGGLEFPKVSQSMPSLHSVSQGIDFDMLARTDCGVRQFYRNGRFMVHKPKR